MTPVEVEKHQRRIADEAFECYDFGSGDVVVEDADDWSLDDNDGEDDFTKVAYVSLTDERPLSDSHKISFHVKFTKGAINFIEAYAYWCENGSDFGHLPPGFAIELQASAARLEARSLKDKMAPRVPDLSASSRPTP